MCRVNEANAKSRAYQRGMVKIRFLFAVHCIQSSAHSNMQVKAKEGTTISNPDSHQPMGTKLGPFLDLIIDQSSTSGTYTLSVLPLDAFPKGYGLVHL